MFELVLSYFTDPILRAPTIACMLMGLSAALVGVIVYLRKQCLIGESLSHAAYPGVILGVLAAFALLPSEWFLNALPFWIILGALVSAFLGLSLIELLVNKLHVRSDSALCFVLSGAFGIGITMASHIQFSHTNLYRKIQIYLYGQAATMVDLHIWIYGVLAFIVLLSVTLLYKEIQVSTFDRTYAKSLGLSTSYLDSFLAFLVALSVVVGVRCVGVVLMSAMLVAPAVTARQYTHCLWKMFILAGIFGAMSGFLGNFLSVELSLILKNIYRDQHVALPTGPMIVLSSSTLCLFSLLFAPERGAVVRVYRRIKFCVRCIQENILKGIWRQNQEKNRVIFRDIRRFQQPYSWLIPISLKALCNRGLVQLNGEEVILTEAGYLKAQHIVRLHRLWEVYLVDELGIGVEKVHRSAEEMEHIITPELEERLNELLDSPSVDPHSQVIPPAGGG